MRDEFISDELKNQDFISFSNKEDAADKYDLAILCWTAKCKRRILEIGTRHGQTAINLAKFSPSDAVVYTIDINDIQDRSEMKKYPEYLQKIRFITADSKTFDFSSLETKFDMIFIDGEHSIEAVVSDTKSAMSVLSSDGIVFWHDFTSPLVVLGIYYTGLVYAQTGSNMALSHGKLMGNTIETRWMGLIESLDKFQKGIK